MARPRAAAAPRPRAMAAYSTRRDLRRRADAPRRAQRHRRRSGGRARRSDARARARRARLYAAPRSSRRRARAARERARRPATHRSQHAHAGAMAEVAAAAARKPSWAGSRTWTQGWTEPGRSRPVCRRPWRWHRRDSRRSSTASRWACAIRADGAGLPPPRRCRRPASARVSSGSSPARASAPSRRLVARSPDRPRAGDRAAADRHARRRLRGATR